MATRKQRKTVEPARGVSIVTHRSGRQGIKLRYTFENKRHSIFLNVEPTPQNIHAANLKMASILFEIEMGTYKPDLVEQTHTPQTPTLHELIVERMERLKTTGKWAISTYSDRAKVYRNTLEPELGSFRLSELTPNIFKDFFKSHPEWTLGYVSTVMSLINPIITSALAEGVITTHPYKHIDKTEYFKSVSTRERKEKINPFTKDEVIRFLSTAQDELGEPWRHFYQLLFFTGIGLQEAVALKWDCIDFKERTITIARVMRYTESPRPDDLKPKSRRKDSNQEQIVDDTKTEGRHRTIELMDVAWESIQAMKSISRVGSEFVFPAWAFERRADSKYEWLSRNMLRRAWRTILIKAGLSSVNRSPKQTRHTFATLSLLEGEIPINIANALGHTSTKMIDQHYGKWIKDSTRPRININLNNAQITSLRAIK